MPLDVHPRLNRKHPVAARAHNIRDGFSIGRVECIALMVVYEAEPRPNSVAAMQSFDLLQEASGEAVAAMPRCRGAPGRAGQALVQFRLTGEHTFDACRCNLHAKQLCRIVMVDLRA
ncbi:hypothetical protein [Rhodococcus sp. JT-3]|uniref:hypothetical protein n=1 Tax=Rhodococcus sp. JT-3 TaxID=1973213 RepID=UPI0013035DAB|nr:hypothetical protein [Rhodococcus sp. JT-3]